MRKIQVSFGLQYDCICPSKKCRQCCEIKSIIDFYSTTNAYCKECIKAYEKEYRKNNRDKLNKWQRDKRKLDSVFRIKSNMRIRLRKVVKNKSASTEKLTGISFNELKLYLESKFDKHMTWDNYGKYWHIDHIIPCAAFDLSDPVQQKQCFHYTNLQPLEAKANRSKKDNILNPVQMKIAI